MLTLTFRAGCLWRWVMQAYGVWEADLGPCCGCEIDVPIVDVSFIAPGRREHRVMDRVALSQSSSSQLRLDPSHLLLGLLLTHNPRR